MPSLTFFTQPKPWKQGDKLPLDRRCAIPKSHSTERVRTKTEWKSNDLNQQRLSSLVRGYVSDDFKRQVLRTKTRGSHHLLEDVKLCWQKGHKVLPSLLCWPTLRVLGLLPAMNFRRRLWCSREVACLSSRCGRKSLVQGFLQIRGASSCSSLCCSPAGNWTNTNVIVVKTFPVSGNL